MCVGYIGVVAESVAEDGGVFTITFGEHQLLLSMTVNESLSAMKQMFMAFSP